MACPSRTSGRPYTANQKEHLQGLLHAGALSREAGASPQDYYRFHPHTMPLNPVVVGALRDRGLADSRSVRRQGRSWTEYWLTVLGREEAGRLARGEATLHG